MKKRMIAALLGTALIVSAAGCGGKTGSDAGAGSGSDADAAASGAVQDTQSTGGETADVGKEAGGASGDVVEIFWQYPAAGEVGEGFYRMEDALNEMMEKDIGVHVTFVPTGLMDSQQDATLMVSSGEQLDIALTAFTGIGNLVEDGLILLLDDYLEEYGPDIVSHCGSKVDGCYYGGTLYALPTCADQVWNTYGYVMKKSFADKYGLEHDDEKLYTLDELEAMFAKVKEGEGDQFYMTAPWNNTYEPLNYALQEYDPVTGSFSAGVLMLNRSFEDLTIYNFFETEEYKAFCERMYDWAQKGYIAPDAAVDTEYTNRGNESNYLGWFGYAAPASDMINENSTWNQEVLMYRTVAPFYKQNGGCTVNWNIPITSAHPEKAVEAINYLYKNTDAATLIQYGFEGEEYEVVEDNGTHQVIRMLGDDPSELPYTNPYGLWGDRFDIPSVYPSSIDWADRMKAAEAEIPEERKSPALGYSFNAESVSSEIAAVETVMEQYCYSFNAGALDPEKALPEFIAALKAAGIDKVIEENQRQIDEWAAGR